jgi:ribosomal protein L4
VSTKPNHRRGSGRISDNGPHFEGKGPSPDAPHVARSRSKWKRRRARVERRTDHSDPKFNGGGAFNPPKVEG